MHKKTMQYTQKDRTRLYSNLDRTTGCWLWKGALRNGYGAFRVQYKTKYAHRVSYELYTNTTLQDLVVVRHACDNRQCINPEHLVQGTHQDNMDDMTNRKRQSKGAARPLAKLTDRDIKTIRHSTETNITLAKQFNVSHQTISDIKLRKLWKHL